MTLRGFAAVTVLAATFARGADATENKKWVSTVGMPLLGPRPTEGPPFRLLKIVDRLGAIGLVSLLHDLSPKNGNEQQFAMIEGVVGSRRDDEVVYALVASASSAVELEQPYRLAAGND